MTEERFQNAGPLVKIWRLRHLLRCPVEFLFFCRRGDLTVQDAWRLAVEMAQLRMNWLYSWPIQDWAEFYPEDHEDEEQSPTTRLSA